MKTTKQINMTTQIVKLLFVLVTTLCLSGCGGDQRNVIVLIDISKSIPANVKEGYLQTIERDVCGKLSQFDKVTVLAIDGAGNRSSEPLMTIDFYENRAKWDVMGQNTKETSDLKKSAFNKFVKDQMEVLRSKVARASESRAELSNMTEILGTLEEAQKYLIPGAQNSIMTFSDMEQYANHLKMKKGTDINTWLHNANAYNLDKLKDIELYAITGNQLHFDQNYCDAIRGFWTAYCAQKGIKLSYNPPTLLADSE